MVEIFKDIKGYEGLYQVSNLGRVKILNYRNTGKTKLKKPVENNCGYFTIQLYKNEKPKRYFVHRLVAETFLDNSDGKPQVNHKIEGDEGKKINIVYINEDGLIDEEKSTIEWVTAKENCNHGTRNKRIAEKTTNGKCSKKVLQLTFDGVLVKEWSSTHECERNGFDHGNVSKCCRGKQKSAYGYKWHYV